MDMQRKAGRSFSSRAKLRDWFERNPARAGELLLRCFKVRARRRGVTYREALDKALCFGWIDGVRHAHDDDSFTPRFTPRRPGSKWSQINRRRLRELVALGRVAPAGLAARGQAKARTGYSFESRPVALSAAYRRRLAAHPQARDYFEQQLPWYQRTSSFWVMSTKQEATRLRRLDQLIACAAAGRPLAPLARKPGGKAFK